MNEESTSKQALITVRYTVKPGKRDEFFRRLEEEGVIEGSRKEPGNRKYDYYFPVDSADDICLLELWTDAEAQIAHGKTSHYQKLAKLKEEYVTEAAVRKYIAEEY